MCSNAIAPGVEHLVDGPAQNVAQAGRGHQACGTHFALTADLRAGERCIDFRWNRAAPGRQQEIADVVGDVFAEFLRHLRQLARPFGKSANRQQVVWLM